MFVTQLSLSFYIWNSVVSGLSLQMCQGSGFRVYGLGFRMTDKVDVPNLITYLNRTPIWEWYAVMFDSLRTDIRKSCLQKGSEYVLKICSPI